MIEKSIVASATESLLAGEYPHLYIVEIAVHPGNRIVVELASDQGVSIDECVRITKHIEAQFDREVEDFELEVGSAGITSAFKVLRQWQGAIDSEVELLRRGGIKERGVLKSATSTEAQLEVVRKVKLEGMKRKTEVIEIISIPMEEVLQCKRVLSF